MNDHNLHDPRIGTTIDEYGIDSLLGEGGMGKVYRATARDGTQVALKLVKEDYARDETFRRRFYREARIAQTVKHPNVVPVLATGEYHGLPYMTQLFVKGCTLDQKVKQDGPLPVKVAVGICHDVAQGLEALWAAGMVHRDVKPANILLDEGGKAYITDFGLAKDTQGSLLTLPGQALGSMDYMAPEQIRGEPVSAESDIYALGCVMYECLCGPPAVRPRAGNADPLGPPPGRAAGSAYVAPGPPPEFAEALLRALAKESGKRPAAAGELRPVRSPTRREAGSAAAASTPGGRRRSGPAHRVDLVLAQQSLEVMLAAGLEPEPRIGLGVLLDRRGDEDLRRPWRWAAMRAASTTLRPSSCSGLEITKPE